MVQLAALEAAMGEMEAARATFEAKACRVSDELAALQQQVVESNLAIARERQAIIGEERKRRRLSGDRTPAAPAPNPDAEAEGAFERSADEVAERLQTARRAMARAHNETLRVRAGVDAAKAAAAPLCSAGRFADAKEARNEECSELVKVSISHTISYYLILSHTIAGSGLRHGARREPRSGARLLLRGRPVADAAREPQLPSLVHGEAVVAAAGGGGGRSCSY
eukprot:SAG31_NODE_455_length_15433_cov_4.248728_10_plen_224_part_00